MIDPLQPHVLGRALPAQPLEGSAQDGGRLIVLVLIGDGRDLSRLLVTTAWEHMDEAARAADPEHGRTFLLDAHVRGKAEPDVRLS